MLFLTQGVNASSFRPVASHCLFICAWLLSWACHLQHSTHQHPSSSTAQELPILSFPPGWRVAVAASFNDSTPAFTNAPSTPPTCINEWGMRYACCCEQKTVHFFSTRPALQHIQLRPRARAAALTSIYMIILTSQLQGFWHKPQMVAEQQVMLVLQNHTQAVT